MKQERYSWPHFLRSTCKIYLEMFLQQISEFREGLRIGRIPRNWGTPRMLSTDCYCELLAIFGNNYNLRSGIVEPCNETIPGPDMSDMTKLGAKMIPQCHSWTRHFSMNIGVKIGIKIGFWLEMWFFHWRCFRVQFILMVRKYFQPFHLTFNYFWWTAEFNFWPIGFLSGLGLFMIIHVWTTLAVCWYVKHWTVKISNTKTTNLIH